MTRRQLRSRVKLTLYASSFRPGECGEIAWITLSNNRVPQRIFSHHTIKFLARTQLQHGTRIIHQPHSNVSKSLVESSSCQPKRKNPPISKHHLTTTRHTRRNQSYASARRNYSPRTTPTRRSVRNVPFPNSIVIVLAIALPSQSILQDKTGTIVNSKNASLQDLIVQLRHYSPSFRKGIFWSG
jgi:hypothetical protein